MPLPSLDALVPPALPLEMSETPRVRGLRFGEGYSQRMADGLNWLDAEARLSWEPITLTEMQSLIQFFRTMKGTSPFTYTMDGETRTYVATDWRKVKNSATSWRVEATLERVFDI